MLPQAVVGAGVPVRTEDGSWWLYDKDERDWFLWNDESDDTAMPNRPEVSESVDDIDFCPWCMACVCCGRPVEIQ